MVEFARKLVYLTAVQLYNHRETDLSGFLSKIDELLKKLEEEVRKAKRITNYDVVFRLLAGFASNLDGILVKPLYVLYILLFKLRKQVPKMIIEVSSNETGISDSIV